MSVSTIRRDTTELDYLKAIARGICGLLILPVSAERFERIVMSLTTPFQQTLDGKSPCLCFYGKLFVVIDREST